MADTNTEDIGCDQKNTTMLKALTRALYNYLKTGISSSVFLFWLSRQGLTLLPWLVLNLWKFSCLRLPSEGFIVAHNNIVLFFSCKCSKMYDVWVPNTRHTNFLLHGSPPFVTYIFFLFFFFWLLTTITATSHCSC